MDSQQSFEVEVNAQSSIAQVKTGRDDPKYGIHATMQAVVEDIQNRLEAYMYKRDMPLIVYEGRQNWYRDKVRPRASWEHVPRQENSFLDALPEELVLEKIWPMLMEGNTDVEKFQVCCFLRPVCRAWRDFVEKSFEWHIGLSAWCRGEQRTPFKDEEDAYTETGSLSDDDSTDDERDSDSDVPSFSD